MNGRIAAEPGPGVHHGGMKGKEAAAWAGTLLLLLGCLWMWLEIVERYG